MRGLVRAWVLAIQPARPPSTNVTRITTHSGVSNVVKTRLNVTGSR